MGQKSKHLNCPPRIMNYFVKRNYLNCVKWLHRYYQYTFDWSEKTYSLAVKYGHLKCLKWLLKRMYMAQRCHGECYDAWSFSLFEICL